MISRSHRWKRWVQWSLAAVVAVDLVLLVVTWRVAQSNPSEQRRELERLRAQHALLKADVERVSAIRGTLPRVNEECDRFVADRLLDAASGYSVIVADLGRIANRAGLHTNSITFQHQELGKRGVVQVDVAATVEGDYASLVRFINGLERSENFYLLDALTLASSTGGGIKLNLQLRSYFRA